MYIKKHLEMLEKALMRAHGSARKVSEQDMSLPGGEMQSLQEQHERRELLERRLSELRQLSEAGKIQLHEAWREAMLLSSEGKGKELPSPLKAKLVRQLDALGARISDLQQQSKRLRGRIHARLLLQSLSPEED
jgi:hypothetical protein